jgi:hypothetical protein
MSVITGAEGSASDEAQPSEENRRADKRGQRDVDAMSGKADKRGRGTSTP